MIRAQAAPANTSQGEWDWAVIIRVANWVLSPSSATKIVRKVAKNSLNQLRREKGSKMSLLAVGGAEMGAGSVVFKA